jgi:hypothetical protein
VNFLDNQCQTGPFRHIQFGLCDNQDSKAAYIDLFDKERWLATVENPNGRDITFTAIDKCVVKDDEAENQKRCDCMLITNQQLYLVELKDWGRGGWQKRSIQQLESTIELLKAAHGEEFLSNYKPKKAYVCNIKKSPFFKPELNIKNHFYKNHKFRLYIQTTIQIP